MGLGLCLSLQAQMTSRSTYRRYTTQDGLPQMQAERLWQDSRGYIYIGTLSGFVRFDGQSFTPFLKGRRINIVGFTELWDKEPHAKQHGEVRALGFFRQWTVGFDRIKAQPLDPEGHWLLNNLNAGSLSDGYVLVEDSLEQHRRLCRMSLHGMEPILTDALLDEMTPDRKLYLDPVSGDVTIPTEGGIYQVTKGAKRAVKLSDKGDVYTILRTDTALLAFASDGVYKFLKDSLKQLVMVGWNSASYGLTVRAIRSGGIIIADEHSVYLYKEDSVRQIATGVNLIRDVLIDRWDRLWVATYQGVYCFFNRCFTNHQLTDDNDIVRAVAVDDRGQLVMGSLNGKVLTMDVSSFNTHCVSNDPEQFFVPGAIRIGNEVFMAGNGDVAAITRGPDGSTTLRWLGLPRDRYQFVGKAWGRLLAANRNGIFALQGRGNDEFSGSPVNPVALDTLTTEILHPWCAAEDAAGLLWIGSSSGLFSIDRQRRVRKTEYQAQKLIISAMEADGQGNIFFASADSVFALTHGHVEALNSQMPQLSGHEVRSLHISPRGYLVVAVVDGLFVCRISKENRLTDIRFYNQQNGFTMTEPLKTMMAETADGTVWLPGVEQMTSFRPADLLAVEQEATYIIPPLRWWQRWWIWLLGLILLSLAVWDVTRLYEKRRNRRRLIRLQREKLQREEQIEAIRQKAIEEVKASEGSLKNKTAYSTDGNGAARLAKDIVRLTERLSDEHITLRTASGTIVVEVKDIAYFKGDGNYSQIVTFHCQDTVLLGLGALEKLLSPEMFVRADRSTLVNIHHICSLLPKQRRCLFRSPDGIEVETTLLAPAFKRLQGLL